VELSVRINKNNFLHKAQAFEQNLRFSKNTGQETKSYYFAF